MPSKRPAAHAGPRPANSTIKRIYRSLPAIACKGLCAESCGPILCSKAEADRMRQKGLIPPTFDAAKWITDEESHALIDAMGPLVPEHLEILEGIDNIRGLTP